MNCNGTTKKFRPRSMKAVGVARLHCGRCGGDGGGGGGDGGGVAGMVGGGRLLRKVRRVNGRVIEVME